MIRALLLAAVSVLVPSLALAQAPPSKSAAAGVPLAQSFRWYDGAQARTVWLDPSAVAEVGAPAGAVSAAVPGAAVERRHGASTVWKLPRAAAADAIARLARAHPQARFSEVLREGPNDAARPRALPGGVLVRLDPAWDAARVDAWLAAHRLNAVRWLPIPNMLVVDTAPGLEALRVANALFESGEVLAASPDWSLSFETR